MSNILIIKTDAFIRRDDLIEIQYDLAKQKESGVVIIPKGWEAIVVPEDIEIKVECKDETEEGIRSCNTCAHCGCYSLDEPCRSCHFYDNWEEKKDDMCN